MSTYQSFIWKRRKWREKKIKMNYIWLYLIKIIYFVQYNSFQMYFVTQQLTKPQTTSIPMRNESIILFYSLHYSFCCIELYEYTLFTLFFILIIKSSSFLCVFLLCSFSIHPSIFIHIHNNNNNLSRRWLFIIISKRVSYQYIISTTLYS